jgi:phage FluMu protein Com
MQGARCEKCNKLLFKTHEQSKTKIKFDKIPDWKSFHYTQDGDAIAMEIKCSRCGTIGQYEIKLSDN